MPRLLVLAAFVLSLSLPLLRADWPQFRGPTGQGLAESAKPPTEWDRSKNVAWRTELPGLGWSSPVIVGGKVYLTTAVGDPGGKKGKKDDKKKDDKKAADPKVDVSLRALCLDAATGKVLWNVEVFKPDAAAVTARHNKNSLASPTPVVEGGKVYVHFGHMGTACLSAADGAKVWATTELRYSPTHGNGGSPVVVGDHLIFSIDATDKQAVVALDKATGKVAWQTPRAVTWKVSLFSFSTPLLIEAGGKPQVVSAGSGVVMGCDPATGKEVWRVRYGTGYSVVPRPVYGHGLVFVSSGYNSPVLYAIRPTGTGDVTDTHVAWKAAKGGPRNSSPVVVGPDLYMVADDGLFSCLDAKTGAVRWAEKLPGDYSASILAAGGHLYLFSEDGVGTVVEPGPEYKEVATNKLGERVLASPAADGNALFVRTEKALYRIENK
jgi:outer membrane protein assembly factor BamB